MDREIHIHIVPVSNTAVIIENDGVAVGKFQIKRGGTKELNWAILSMLAAVLDLRIQGEPLSQAEKRRGANERC